MNGNLYAYYIIGVFAIFSVNVFILLVILRYRPNIGCSPLVSYSVILAAGYLLVFQYLKYQSLGFYADFSHWGEIISNTASTGQPFSRSVQFLYPDSLNYLSIHFAPLVYMFAVPFRFFPYSETILLLNFLLMISAAIPLYKLAMLHNEDRRFGLFMIILLFWFPTFQYIVLYEFEMLRFSIPIVLWMLYFWKKRMLPLYFISVVLAVLIREDVGLTIIMFGLYLLLIRKDKWIGVATTCIGLAAFFVITQVIMPSLNAAEDYRHIAAPLFSSFGDSPIEIVKGIVRDPGLVLKTVLNPVKLANIFMYLLPLLFVPCLSLGILLATCANIGVVLLSKSVTHSSYFLYYLSPSIPFIFYAFITAWPKMLSILKRISAGWSGNANGEVRPTAMLMVLSSCLISNIFFGPSPVSLQFWFKDLRPAPFRTHNYHYSAYRITDHHRKVESFCSLIPDSAVVSAEQFLFPRLFKKNGMMVFPQLESVDGETKADYVFIDKQNPMKTGIGAVPGSYYGLRENPQEYYDLVEKQPNRWELVRADDGYYLYRRIKTVLRAAG